MPLSLHIAHGNARRVAGKKGQAKATSLGSKFCAVLRLELITHTRSAVIDI
jgi:hypothetical protein